MTGYHGLPLPAGVKFTICIIADLFDFSFGRVMLGIGTVGDVIGAALMFVLWGPLGLLAVWEAVDVTEQLDGFVPTNTMIAWAAHKRARASVPSPSDG